MKRPDGVRPAGPAPSRPRATEQPEPRGSDHPTEPITVVTGLTVRPGSGNPRAARTSRARPEKSQPQKSSAEKLSAGASSPAEPSAAKTATATAPRVKSPAAPTSAAASIRSRASAFVGGIRLPGSERRAVRRAARERKRFERGEVRRFTKRARRRRMIALVSAGSLAALAVVVAVAAYSPLMAVKSIEISGTERVDAAALQNSLDDQIGVPLTLVDRGAIGDVLGGYPLIRSYSVQTRPPSTLVVTIVERTPVGVIANGSQFDLVDPAGVVIETAPAAEEGYPLLTTPAGSASGAAFRTTAQVLLTLPEALESQVASASATTGDDVSLTLDDGAVVVWGGSDDSALKAVVLEKLMAATDPTTIASYDVSSPQAAVVAER